MFVLEGRREILCTVVKAYTSIYAVVILSELTIIAITASRVSNAAGLLRERSLLACVPTAVHFRSLVNLPTFDSLTDVGYVDDDDDDKDAGRARDSHRANEYTG